MNAKSITITHDDEVRSDKELRKEIAPKADGLIL